MFLCVFAVRACVSACLPVCLRLNKGLFCISVLSSPSSPSSLTFYCELLGDWQKRSAVQPFIYFPLSFPSSIHPSIHPSVIHPPPPVYLHLSNPLPPHVFVSFPFRYQTCSHCLLVFTAPSHPPHTMWCLGNRVHTHTHTLPLFTASHCPHSLIHMVRDIGLGIDAC